MSEKVATNYTIVILRHLIHYNLIKSTFAYWLSVLAVTIIASVDFFGICIEDSVLAI